MQVKRGLRLAAGALGCFSAGILVADVVYKLSGAQPRPVDLSVVALVLAWVGVVLAVLGWRRAKPTTPLG